MKTIKMNVNDLLFSNYQDLELLALIKYRAMYFYTGQEPTIFQLKWILKPKQIEFLLHNEDAIEKIAIPEVVKKLT